MPCCRIYITVMSKVCLTKCWGFGIRLQIGFVFLKHIGSRHPHPLTIYTDPVFLRIFRPCNSAWFDVNAGGEPWKVYWQWGRWNIRGIKAWGWVVETSNNSTPRLLTGKLPTTRLALWCGAFLSLSRRINSHFVLFFKCVSFVQLHICFRCELWLHFSHFCIYVSALTVLLDFRNKLNQDARICAMFLRPLLHYPLEFEFPCLRHMAKSNLELSWYYTF